VILGEGVNQRLNLLRIDPIPRNDLSEMKEPKTGDLHVNGVRIRYQDWGGSGAPIIVLHATGFLGRIYASYARAFTKIGRVFSYDQRGHGDSGLSPDGEYNWARTMDDLEAFLIAMGLNGVCAFGHSAGATAIGSLAAKRPDLIERAVLSEPVIFESPTAPELGWRNPFIERTLKRKRSFASVDAMFANFEKKPPYHTWRRDILRDYCEYGTRPTPHGSRELKCTPEVEARFYETSRDFDGLGEILRADIPMLILFGEKSDSLASTLADKVAARRRKGRVINVPDTGHFMPMEIPDALASMAVEFFQK